MASFSALHVKFGLNFFPDNLQIYSQIGETVLVTQMTSFGEVLISYIKVGPIVKPNCF